MMQAGLAAAGDVAALKSLWRTCFGDEESYIDQFFERVFQVEQSFTLRQDGKLTAMAFYFPLTLSLGREEKNVAYLYAVCTDPAYRGQGQSTALLEFIAGYLAIKGYQGLALVPGTPDLFEFYEKRGYRPAFFNQVTTLTDIPLAEGKVARAEGHEYNAVREKLLENTSYVRYSDGLLDYQRVLCRQNGGDLTAFTDTGERFGCAALEYVAESRVLIKELIWPGDLAEAVAILKPHFPAATYVVRSPGGTHPFGMYRSLELEDEGGDGLYLGFAFD